MKLSHYAILMTVIIVAAGIGAYWWSTKGYGEEKTPIVKEGDTISVKYYGYIYYSGERRIFDTNIEKVARDNASYPKTVSYKWSGNFDPLTFTVGEHTMIEGFEKGVIGMKLNETKTIVVPPDEGYAFDWSKVKNYTLTQTVSVVENLTLEEFKNRFGKENPSDNSVYRDGEHGWNSLVIEVNPTKNVVTIMNMPEASKYYQPYENIEDYKIYVERIKDGILTIKYVIERTSF